MGSRLKEMEIYRNTGPKENLSMNRLGQPPERTKTEMQNHTPERFETENASRPPNRFEAGRPVFVSPDARRIEDEMVLRPQPQARKDSKELKKVFTNRIGRGYSNSSMMCITGCAMPLRRVASMSWISQPGQSVTTMSAFVEAMFAALRSEIFLEIS